MEKIYAAKVRHILHNEPVSHNKTIQNSYMKSKKKTKIVQKHKKCPYSSPKQPQNY